MTDSTSDNNKPKEMEEKSFRELLESTTFVVPEIQREYVWGASENKHIIDNFIKSIKVGNLNIGFLYSYTPSSADEKEKISHLIDGQQRFTTLYLLAFVAAVVKDEKPDNFNQFKEKYANKFSYRVRYSTAQFLQKLVEKVKGINDLEMITDKTWFLSNYKNDVSISNMLSLIDHVKGHEDLPSYENVLNVKFHHFNISVAGQGEELYITMNSRGEPLQDNENLRAYLLERCDKDKKQVWAKKYDDWQEFFWKHRGDNANANANADIGFNAFIRLVMAIEFYKHSKEEKNDTKFNDKLSDFRYHNKENKKGAEFNYSNYFKYLDFDKLDSYYSKLEVIIDILEPEENKKMFREQFDKSKLLNDSINDIYFMFFLPMLVINSYDDKKFIRFFYNIAFNKKSTAYKSVLDLATKINEVNIDDPIKLLNLADDFKNLLLDDEEKLKLTLYKNANNGEELEKLKTAFWLAEDSHLWAGEISTLINWAGGRENFNIDPFNYYYDRVCEIFGIEDLDLLRRALITLNLDGYPHSYKYNCFTFINGYSLWKTLLQNNSEKISKFLDVFKNDEKIEQVLEDIIGRYNDDINTYYNFIKHPELLQYSKSKRVDNRYPNYGLYLLKGDNLHSAYISIDMCMKHIEYRGKYNNDTKWKLQELGNEKGWLLQFRHNSRNAGIDIYRDVKIKDENNEEEQLHSVWIGIWQSEKIVDFNNLKLKYDVSEIPDTCTWCKISRIPFDELDNVIEHIQNLYPN